MEELNRERDRLRTETVELCRQHKFRVAMLLFERMTHSDHHEFRNWAVLMQDAVRNAEQAYNLVYNSGELLAGIQTPNLPDVLQPEEVKQHAKLRLTRIRLDSIQIDVICTKKDKYNRPERDENGDPIVRLLRRQDVSLTKLTNAQMWTFCKLAWKRRNEKDTAHLNLSFACYLLVRKENLFSAANILQGTPEGKRFVALCELPHAGTTSQDQ